MIHRFMKAEVMRTRTLKTLLEVERVGTFIGAAEQLNMTLSSVSMQMKSLEDQLGVALFDRAYRPPKLTPLGHAICRSAEEMLTAEADLLLRCQTTRHLTGQFRVGFVATASVRLLPGFLVRAKAQAPDAHFDIETGLSDQLEAGLRNGRLDAAVITASRAAPSGLSYRQLARERLVYAVPSGAARLSPKALFGHLPFLHFMPQSGIGKLIEEHIDQLRPARSQTLFLDSVEAIMECVRHELGFTLLPEPDILRQTEDGIAIVEIADAPLTRDLVLASLARPAEMAQADQMAALFGQPGKRSL